MKEGVFDGQRVAVGGRAGTMRLYLGAPSPTWLERTAVPLFLSRRTLARRKRLPVASGPWALDSGGFTELNAAGGWSITPQQYAGEVARWAADIGKLVWAAVMDWMCEPFVLAKTGLTVADHQQRTIASYLTLRDLAPGLPWVPVLQGWTRDDYRRHADAYDRAGVTLAALPLVGLGSICRRQHTADAAAIVRQGWADGLRLHAFGLKVKGLRAVGACLASADSMAWSYQARRAAASFCGSTRHQKCNYCLVWALAWRERALALRCAPAVAQLSLFGGVA